MIHLLHLQRTIGKLPDTSRRNLKPAREDAPIKKFLTQLKTHGAMGAWEYVRAPRFKTNQANRQQSLRWLYCLLEITTKKEDTDLSLEVHVDIHFINDTHF